MASDKSNSRNESWHWTKDEIGVAVQSLLWVRVELMAVWTEFTGRGFKCHSGQPSIATSKNPSVVNTILLSKTIKNRQSGKK